MFWMKLYCQKFCQENEKSRLNENFENKREREMQKNIWSSSVFNFLKIKHENSFELYLY